MNGVATWENAPEDLATPLRNHYFYGKLLDVFHMELETEYMNAKRSTLNRLVTGWGVVCGLDVRSVEEGSAIVVTAGFALDPWGREVIVPNDSPPQRLAEVVVEDYPAAGDPGSSTQAAYAPAGNDAQQRKGGAKEPSPEPQEIYYHVVLCYNECQSNPTPMLTADCRDDVLCAAGTIEERYRIEIRPGAFEPFPIWDCNIPDSIGRGELRYEVLVRWVTDNCPELPKDSCVPLANIRVRWSADGSPYCGSDDIEITVRPLALSNRALFYLLLSLLNDTTPGRRGTRTR